MGETNRKGNLSIAKVLTACMDEGWLVSIPVGDAHPYDLIVDNGQRILRCQVKTGQFVNGCVVFSLRSNNGRWYKKETTRTYHGKVDVFGVYCPQVGQVFMVPIEETGKSTKWLRLEPQRENRNWRNRDRNVDATKYRIGLWRVKPSGAADDCDSSFREFDSPHTPQ